MPITTVDPATALILVDLQQAIAQLPWLAPLTSITGIANRLTAEFRRRRLTVINVVADGVKVGRNDQGRTTRAMGPAGMAPLDGLLRCEHDHLVVKRHWGAFTDTRLEPFLRERSVTQLVIVGVATSIGVESTVRHACELGFNIAVATDAVTDLNAESHGHSLQVILPRISETGPASAILDALARNDPARD